MTDKLERILPALEYAGIYHLPHTDCAALQKAAKNLGYAWHSCDFGEISTIGAVLERIGRDCGFPPWYGANYDALADCLGDPAWGDAPGVVLLFSGADELHACDLAAFDTLNAVVADVIAARRTDGVPFWVFYDMRPDGLAALPTLAAA